MEILAEQNYWEFDRFCEKQHAHFMQAPFWRLVKENWMHDILVLRGDSGEIAGGVLLLRKKIPLLPFCILYAPRGPVLSDAQLQLDALIADIRLYGKKHRAFLLKIDPDAPADQGLRALLINSGFRLLPASDRLGNTQPHFVYRLDIQGQSPEQILAHFKSKTRYNIRVAQKRGVQVHRAGPDGLAEFYRLLIQTGKRDGFPVRQLAYFERLLASLGDHARLYLANYEGQSIAGAIAICYGGRTWYLYGASSALHRNAMPNYLLQYQMICDAIASDCHIYDFRGISGDISNPDNPLYGLYRFKHGFNGQICELTGEYEAVLCRPVYALAQIALKLRSLAKRLKLLIFRRLR